MNVGEFARLARNIVAVIGSIDPIDVFPDLSQSEQRIRFRNDPFREFLRADDATQVKISELARARVENAISDFDRKEVV